MAAVAKGDLSSSLGVYAGTTRLEVLWAMEGDEGEEDVWWPCLFLGPAGRTHTLEEEGGESLAVPVQRVRYDLTHYPEPSESEVCLLNINNRAGICHGGYQVSLTAQESW